MECRRSPLVLVFLGSFFYVAIGKFLTETTFLDFGNVPRSALMLITKWEPLGNWTKISATLGKERFLKRPSGNEAFQSLRSLELDFLVVPCIRANLHAWDVWKWVFNFLCDNSPSPPPIWKISHLPIFLIAWWAFLILSQFQISFILSPHRKNLTKISGSSTIMGWLEKKASDLIGFMIKCSLFLMGTAPPYSITLKRQMTGNCSFSDNWSHFGARQVTPHGAFHDTFLVAASKPRRTQVVSDPRIQCLFDSVDKEIVEWIARAISGINDQVSYGFSWIFYGPSARGMTPRINSQRDAVSFVVKKSVRRRLGFQWLSKCNLIVAPPGIIGSSSRQKRDEFSLFIPNKRKKKTRVAFFYLPREKEPRFANTIIRGIIPNPKVARTHERYWSGASPSPSPSPPAPTPFLSPEA